MTEREMSRDVITYGPLRDVEGSRIPELIGKRVVEAQHLISDASDADERVWLEFDDGTEMLIATSEWLSVEVHRGNESDAHKSGRVN